MITGLLWRHIMGVWLWKWKHLENPAKSSSQAEVVLWRLTWGLPWIMCSVYIYQWHFLCIESTWIFCRRLLLPFQIYLKYYWGFFAYLYKLCYLYTVIWRLGFFTGTKLFKTKFQSQNIQYFLSMQNLYNVPNFTAVLYFSDWGRYFLSLSLSVTLYILTL